MFGFGKPKRTGPMGVEDQLTRFAQLGIQLRPDRSVDELMLSWERGELEAQPFGALLYALGGVVEEGLGEGQPFCDRVLHQDTECIEDQGDYTRFVDRAIRLFCDGLGACQVEDQLFEEQGLALVRLLVDGVQYKVKLELDEDWLDLRILNALLSIAAQRGVATRLAIAEPDGQDVLIVSGTKKELEAVAKLAGLKLSTLPVDPNAYRPVG